MLDTVIIILVLIAILFFRLRLPRMIASDELLSTRSKKVGGLFSILFGLVLIASSIYSLSMSAEESFLPRHRAIGAIIYSIGMVYLGWMTLIHKSSDSK